MNKITRFVSLLAVLTVAVQMALAAVPSNYYNSAYGKSNEQLMIALRGIICNHTAKSYDALWDAFKTTDTDDQGYIIDMYSNCKYRPTDHGGSASNVGEGFNREHSFPKSWFDNGKPMYTDLFHMYPTDIRVNNQRSNYPFGECADGTRLTNGSLYGKGKLGSSTFPGYSGTVFEPDDEYKGDFARTYFYMVTRYKNELPNWSGSPQLDYKTNKYKAFSTWSINLLVKWARLDPVSEKEIKRNEAVYGIQNNRNPFIDNPELFEYIWGDKQGEVWLGGSGDNEPTIISPEDGSTIVMGSTTIGTELPCTITFKGKNLNNWLSLSMDDNTNFYVDAISFNPVDVNNGTSFTVTFMPQEEGEFENHITLSSSEVSTTFTVTAKATKQGVDPGPGPVLGDSIVEDWEGCKTGGYWTQTVAGHAWSWEFVNAGIFGDNLSHGSLSCRLGKTSSSSITMNEDVDDIGAIGLWAASYGTDENATLRVDFSTNQGLSWTELDSFTVTRGILQQFILDIPMEDPVRFRIMQTSGARVNIDDIALYKQVHTVTIKGDVNRDGVVNITDVNVVINVILNGWTSEAADVNGDNTVNIADINAIINEILNN